MTSTIDKELNDILLRISDSKSAVFLDIEFQSYDTKIQNGSKYILNEKFRGGLRNKYVFIRTISIIQFKLTDKKYVCKTYNFKFPLIKEYMDNMLLVSIVPKFNKLEQTDDIKKNDDMSKHSNDVYKRFNNLFQPLVVQHQQKQQKIYEGYKKLLKITHPIQETTFNKICAELDYEPKKCYIMANLYNEIGDNYKWNKVDASQKIYDTSFNTLDNNTQTMIKMEVFNDTKFKENEINDYLDIFTAVTTLKDMLGNSNTLVISKGCNDLIAVMNTLKYYNKSTKIKYYNMYETEKLFHDEYSCSLPNPNLSLSHTHNCAQELDKKYGNKIYNLIQKLKIIPQSKIAHDPMYDAYMQMYNILTIANHDKTFKIEQMKTNIDNHNCEKKINPVHIQKGGENYYHKYKKYKQKYFNLKRHSQTMKTF